MLGVESERDVIIASRESKAVFGCIMEDVEAGLAEVGIFCGMMNSMVLEFR